MVLVSGVDSSFDDGDEGDVGDVGEAGDVGDVGGGENGDGGDGGDTECDNVGGNDGGGPSACSLCLGRSK